MIDHLLSKKRLSLFLFGTLTLCLLVGCCLLFLCDFASGTLYGSPYALTGYYLTFGENFRAGVTVAWSFIIAALFFDFLAYLFLIPDKDLSSSPVISAFSILTAILSFVGGILIFFTPLFLDKAGIYLGWAGYVAGIFGILAAGTSVLMALIAASDRE
jgi:hypothetical protein